MYLAPFPALPYLRHNEKSIDPVQRCLDQFLIGLPAEGWGAARLGSSLPLFDPQLRLGGAEPDGDRLIGPRALQNVWTTLGVLSRLGVG